MSTTDTKKERLKQMLREKKARDEEMQQLRVKWAVADTDHLYFDGTKLKLRRGGQEWVLEDKAAKKGGRPTQLDKKREKERKRQEEEEKKRRGKEQKEEQKRTRKLEREEKNLRKQREKEAQEARRKTWDIGCNKVLGRKNSLDEWREKWHLNDGDRFRAYRYSGFHAGPRPNT
ncbi:hypothetical protein VTK26DRAFT_9513 [Humicola hyalothermophila]